MCFKTLISFSGLTLNSALDELFGNLVVSPSHYATVKVGQLRMFKLDLGLLEQTIEDFSVVFLPEVLEAQSYGFSLSELPVPMDGRLHDVRAVVAVERHKPNGKVEAGSPRLDGKDLDKLTRKGSGVEGVSQGEGLWLSVVTQPVVRQLDHVLLVHAAVDLETLEVADVCLLVLAEGDAADDGRLVQLQDQKLGRSIRV